MYHFVNLLTLLLAASAAVFSQTTENLIVADFNKSRPVSNIGTDFGTWDKDPADPTQGCQMKFIHDDSIGNAKGYSLRLSYDVDSPRPAFNGFWMKLGSRKTAEFGALSFSVKGDKDAGFPQRIKIEIKTGSGKALVNYIDDISDIWKTIDISLQPIATERLTEFTIVFEDTVSRPKTGAILIDQIVLKR